MLIIQGAWFDVYGLGETFDYLNIGIVAIMFQLLWDVAACEIFID